MDDQLSFDELYRFDFPWSNDLDHSVLDRALQFLFFMAGVSYYKTYLPPQIVIQRGQLDKIGADFFSKTYRKGLGEFFYINNLDPNTPLPLIFRNINYQPPMGIVYGELREGGPVPNRGFDFFSAMMRLSSRVFSMTQSGFPMKGAEE